MHRLEELGLLGSTRAASEIAFRCISEQCVDATEKITGKTPRNGLNAIESSRRALCNGLLSRSRALVGLVAPLVCPPRSTTPFLGWGKGTTTHECRHSPTLARMAGAAPAAAAGNHDHPNNCIHRAYGACETRGSIGAEASASGSGILSSETAFVALSLQRLRFLLAHSIAFSCALRTNKRPNAFSPLAVCERRSGGGEGCSSVPEGCGE